MANFKKVLAVALSAAMVLTAVPMANVNAAKKVALSAKKGTIQVKKTKKVTIKNTKKANITKVTFKYSKKNIAKATWKKATANKITIKGLKAGKTKITATIKLKNKVAGKKTYKLTYTATVKKAATPAAEVKTTAISLDKAQYDVVAGQTATAVATVTPTDSTQAITWTSADEKIATVSAGVITGVAAGETTITATSGDFQAQAKVVVTAAEVIAKLTGVKQLTADSIEATFDVDASKIVKKEDFVLQTEDKTLVLPVKEFKWSADGKTAVVSFFNAFTDKTNYVVEYKDATSTFTASVGDVAAVKILTTSAQQNVRTKIEFALTDANGIDVTAAKDVASTVNVSVEGQVTSYETNKSTDAYLTMGKVGDKCTVKVVYNSNATGAQDIVATQEVSCIEPEAVKGTAIFTSTSSINLRSGCAKFYKDGITKTNLSVEEDASDTNVFFCAKDANGDVISYDSYEASSSLDDVLGVSVTKDSGKYAQLTISGNKVGNAYVNITAKVNGKETPYTIPVTVTKKGELASVNVTLSKSSMSNAIDPDYGGTVDVKVYDSNQKDITADDQTQISIALAEASEKKAAQLDSNLSDAAAAVATGFVVNGAKYTAYGAQSGSYTIQVDVAKDGKEIQKKSNVSVKTLSKDAWAGSTGNGVKLTYAIEMGSQSIDEASPYTSATYARLYATANNLFVGYVRTRELADGKTVTTVGLPVTSTTGAGGVAGTASSVELTGGAKFTATNKGVAYDGYKFVTLAPTAATVATAIIDGYKLTANDDTTGVLNNLAVDTVNTGDDNSGVVAAYGETAGVGKLTLTFAENGKKTVHHYANDTAIANIVTEKGADYVAEANQYFYTKTEPVTGKYVFTEIPAEVGQAVGHTCLMSTTHYTDIDVIGGDEYVNIGADDVTAALGAATGAGTALATRIHAVTAATSTADATNKFAGFVEGGAAKLELEAGTKTATLEGNGVEVGKYVVKYTYSAQATTNNQKAKAEFASLAEDTAIDGLFELTTVGTGLADGKNGFTTGGVDVAFASAGSIVKADASTTISKIKAGIKYGTGYSLDGDLFDAKNNIAAEGPATMDEDGIIIIDSVNWKSNDTMYYVSGDMSNDAFFAKTGSYTITFEYVYDQKPTENIKKTNNLSVSNSLEKALPSIAVKNRTVEGFGDDDIAKNLRISVDMNNNESEYDSMTGAGNNAALVSAFAKNESKAAEESNSKMTVKYAGVIDNVFTAYDANGNVDFAYNVVFYMPINTTFYVK